MGAIRNAGLTSIRLVGALLLVIVLSAGLIAPDRASAATTFAAGDPVVTTDEVNVRTRAGTSAPVRAVAAAGQPFTIGQIKAKKANGLTWYRVSTATRVNYGWIASDFLALDFPFEEGDCATVFDGSLNLRSKAGTGGLVVTVLADGAGVTVLANDPVKANGYLWYRVRAFSGDETGETGWVASQFLQLQNCGSTDEPVIEIGATVRVVDGPLNARVEPDTSADIVRVLQTETIGWIIDGPTTADGYTWFEFRNLGGLNGWIVADFIEADPDIVICDGMAPCSSLKDGDSLVVTTDALNVRTAAGLDGEIIDTAAFGATGTVVDGDFDFVDGQYWVKVSIPNVGTGWVSLEFVEEA